MRTLSTIFEKKIAHKNIKNDLNRLGRAVFSTVNQPKSQIMFHKNVSPRDLYILNDLEKSSEAIIGLR